MLRVVLFLALAFPLVTVSARGAETPAVPRDPTVFLTLPAAVAEALRSDAGSAALARRCEHLRLAAALAGAPSPASFRVSVVAGQPESAANALTQSLELGGQPSRRRQQARWELRVAEAALVTRRAEVAHRVAGALVRLAATREAADLAGEEKDFQEALHALALRRFQAGDVPQSHVIRVERDRARAVRELVSAERERDAAGIVLAVVLGRPPEQPLLPAVVVELPALPVEAPSELIRQALQARPELEGLRAEVETARSEVVLVRAQRAPVLDLSLYQARWSGPGRESGASASLSWPLLDWGRQSAQVARAQARAEEATASLAALEREVAGTTLEAWTRWSRLAQERALLEGEELGRADRLTAMVRRGYEGGLSTQLELIEARRSMRDLRAQLVQLRAQERQTVWDFVRASGRPFPGTGGGYDGKP